MRFLNFGRDVQGMNAYAPVQSDLKYSATLAAGAGENLTVPSSTAKWIVGFSYQPGASIWVSVNGTAAVPAGGTFLASTSELNPPARTVFAGDVINMITANTTADVGIVLYATS